MFFISPFESTVSHKNQVSCWVFFLGERNSVKVARKSKKRQPGLLILDSGKTRKNRSGRKHFSLAKKYIFCQHFLFFYSLEIFSGSCLFFPLFSQQESIKNHPKRGWDWQFPRRQEPKRAFFVCATWTGSRRVPTRNVSSACFSQFCFQTDMV